MPDVRTGLVAVTLALEAICRTIRKYRPKMDDALAAAVTGGVITSDQKATVTTFLDITQAACDVLRIVTGY